MKKMVSCLLAVILLLGAVLPSFAESEQERRRGMVEIIDTPVDIEEDIDEALLGEADDEEAQENSVVYDPIEEILYEEALITDAFDKLDGMRNILLLGVDARDDGFSGRTDTMILLTIDIEGKIIKMTSFMRDLYVEIPGHKNNRLNAAYVFGGYDLLKKTFEKNFGVSPDAYVIVNLNSLSTIIDKLGGVYIDVDAKKIDRVNAVIYWYNKQVLGLSNLKDGYLTKGGYQLLNGKQAESWARYRYSESDAQRTARQRQLITIIFNTIKEMPLSELVAFAMENIGLIRTNLSIMEIIQLAPAVIAMGDAQIREMRIPVDGAYQSKTVSGMSVIVPDRQKNANKLAEFLKAK